MKSETRRLNKLKDTSRNLAKRYKLSEAALRIIGKAGTKPELERERASRAIRHLLDLSTSASPQLSYLVEAISERDVRLIDDLQRLVDEKLHELRGKSCRPELRS